MISGKFINISQYVKYFPDKLREILLKIDISKLDLSKTNTKVELVNDQLFYLYNQYQTRDPLLADYEYHNRYADLQLVLSGSERIYLADLPSLPTLCYEDNDIGFVSGINDNSSLVLASGDFALILPPQLHKPSCHYQELNEVCKIVFKIAADWFHIA